MAHLKKIKPFMAAFSTLLVLSMLSQGGVQAQTVDSFEDDETMVEPTPIEELSPGGGEEVIPGTEPLYDKGITVTEIEITGNKLVPAETILQAIDTRPGSLYSKRRLQNDLKKLYDLGYFTERIRVVPVATREGVHLRFEVEENTVVNEIRIEGETVLNEQELKAPFDKQIGMPQNVNIINQGIKDLEALYKDKGYILARVDEIEEDPPGVITLTMNEGKIHDITFVGNKKTKDYVVRRAMAQKAGEVYNENTVNQDLKRIFSMQTFSDVRRVVKASPEVEGEYDLVLELDEKKTGAISLGGGVDTGTGVFGSVGYNDPNFLGRGQNISTVFSVGTGVLGSDSDTVDQTVVQFQSSWFTPSIGETPNSLGVSVFARELASFNVPLAIERRIGSQIDWGRPLQSRPGVSVSLGLGAEDVNMREGVSQARLNSLGITPTERQEQLEDGTFIFLVPALAQDSRNNRFNPSEGWLNTFGARLAYGVDADSYGTFTANLRRYLKVTDNVIFAVNTQGGTTAIGNVPQFNLFRLGGAYTIRGFQEGGVGVGEDYVLGSAELRAKLPFLKRFDKFPLYDMVQWALFTDAGYLFNQASTNDVFDRPGYGIAVGTGLRVNMPALGPLRIDWAVPMGGKTGANTRRFNFGVGQKF